MLLNKPFALSAMPDEAEAEWERFCAAAKAQKIKIPKEGLGFEALSKIFGNSRFLARFAVRHPASAIEAVQSPYLKKTKALSHFSHELGRIDSPELEPWLKKIRRYKYRELFRIMAKDLAGASRAFGASDEVVLTELSDLAEAIVTAVDRRIFALSIAAKKTPLPPPKKRRYHIFALGKLGGRELNLSSDIDLVAVTEGDEGHQFFVRHVQGVTKALADETENGFLYRVDWDLRPEGSAGTLVNSVSAMVSYYENFGADWERQAWTKGRPLAGDPALGEEFLKRMEPFIYRKSLDLTALHHIQAMKQKIRAELDKKPPKGFHVKLGIGGIREIEFFVQAFLLIYGGKKPEIRHTGTIETLARLETAGLVSLKDAASLKESYLFLRRLEHRLQLEDERQTHLLSPDPAEQLKTARRMGYFEKDPEEALKRFQDQLETAVDNVHRIFESLFAETTPGSPENRQILWGGTPSENATIPSAEQKDEALLTEYRQALQDRLAQWPKLEDWFDEIRYFKKDEIKKIVELEHNPGVPKESTDSLGWKPAFSRRDILCRLSLLAEAICQETLLIVLRELEPKYGRPIDADIMTVGMGKLGGREINYGSDLDLIFIFSQMGETTGAGKISNSEYFARLVQKFISILSLTTRAGRAYAIDTELRPSGHQGPLVTSLEGFIDYQKTASQIWERQSLLRARPIAGPPHFARLVRNHIDALLYSRPFSSNIVKEMHRLRTRVECEIARESESFIDMKGGKGGVMDIEFFLQYHQLIHGRDFPKLHTANTFDGLETLAKLKIVPEATVAPLVEAYTFYRDVESRIYLRKQRSQRRWNVKDPFLDEIARDLKLKNSAEFLEKYLALREKVRKIYTETFIESYDGRDIQATKK